MAQKTAPTAHKNNILYVNYTNKTLKLSGTTGWDNNHGYCNTHTFHEHQIFAI